MQNIPDSRYVIAISKYTYGRNILSSTMPKNPSKECFLLTESSNCCEDQHRQRTHAHKAVLRHKTPPKPATPTNGIHLLSPDPLNHREPRAAPMPRRFPSCAPVHPLLYATSSGITAILPLKQFWSFSASGTFSLIQTISEWTPCEQSCSYRAEWKDITYFPSPEYKETLLKRRKAK